MRVAIEATPLTLSSGGLARYTSELSLALARCFPEDEFFLISDQAFRMPEGSPANLKRGGGPRNQLERRWWLWGISRELSRLGADVVHGPDFAVPYIATRPSVMSLHDLSPWLDRRWHNAAGRVRRRTPVLLEWGIATMVVTHSEAVRRQAIQHFRLEPERIVAVPPAAPSWMRPVAQPPGRSYFLFVGTLEPRKNIHALIDAWRPVGQKYSIELALAGRRRADFAEIPDEPGLRVLGEVPDSDLPMLYSGALAFVYPSHYEGFGLPVLEAMQCGAPVIASTAVREAAGDAAVFADSTEELTRAMSAAAEAPDYRDRWRARSLAHAAAFSWERTARATYEVYLEARRRFDR